MSSPANSTTTRRGSRWYTDPADPTRRLVSVTTVLRETSSSAGLISWAAKLAAEYAIDHRAALDDLGRDVAVTIAAEAPDRARKTAGARGSAVHAVAEALALDAPVPPVDPDVADVVDRLLDFVVDYDVEWHAAEATVASTVHGYAGTLDAIVRVGALDRVLMLDLKTGNTVPPDSPAQLAAYRGADELWLPHGGKAKPPEVDGTAVLHLRPDGYRLVDADLPGVWDEWLAALDLYRRQQERPRQLKVLRRPGEPIPLVDVPTLGRCRSALTRAGVQTLTDLAGWSERDLLALDGIGPQAVVYIREALDAHGLVEEVPA